MFKGMNIDITNNAPDPDLLNRLGVGAVRFPSRPGIDWYIERLIDRHIYTLAVLDEDSRGRICGGGHCSAYQNNNEPDGRGVPIDTMIQELVIYRDTYPDLVLVAPGLNKGDYDANYLRAIYPTLREYRYAAVALHTYNKTPEGAVDLTVAHWDVAPELPIMWTESHPEADDMRLFYDGARRIGVAAVFHHCWTDAMTLAAENLRFGVVDEYGKHKRDLGLWLFA